MAVTVRSCVYGTYRNCYSWRRQRTSRRQTVQATLDPAHGDDVQVLGTAVVAAVHNRSHGQTEGHTVLVALRTGTPCRRGNQWTKKESSGG